MFEDSDIGPLLEELGYKYISGWGPSAVWEGEDADGETRKFAQSALANSLLGDNSPYTPRATKQADTQVVDGVLYERTADGGWRPARGIPTKQAEGRYVTANGVTYYIDPEDPTNAIPVVGTPSGGGGMTAGQQAQLAQDAYQFDVTQQTRAREFEATTAANRAAEAAAGERWLITHMENMRTAAVNEQIAKQNAALLERRANFEEEQGRGAAARDSMRLAEEQANNARQYQLQLAGMAEQKRQFEVSMRFQAQQANAAFEERRQDRLVQTASQVGELARDPGDRGVWAGTIAALGNRWGAGNEAASGKSYITTESLAPLEQALRGQEAIQNAPLPFNMNDFQVGAPVALPGMNAGTTAQPEMSGPIPETRLNEFAQTSVRADGSFDEAAFTDALRRDWAARGMEKAAGGGVLTSAMRMVGERGPELEIDLANGSTLILNKGQIDALKGKGLDLMDESDAFRGGGLAHYAEGGIFAGVLGAAANDTDRTRSLSLLDRANEIARRGTGLRAGMLPSPIALSSPGTDPAYARLIAALKQQAEGVPLDSTLFYANQYRPIAMSERIVGRTR